MSSTKLNLELYDTVRLHSTGGSELDGKTGYNLGKSFEDRTDHYMILLDVPTNTHLAISITESCIERFHVPDKLTFRYLDLDDVTE